MSKKGLTFLKTNKIDVSHIVVDEAHCVVQWGESFRTAFADIRRLRSLFPSAKMLALTATATIKMRRDLAQLLGMTDFRVVASSVDRPNLKFVVSRRSPTCGGNYSVEESFKKIFLPFIEQLQVERDNFPKTIIYTKLKWCGFGHELALKSLSDDMSEYVAQFHSPCTKEMRSHVLSSIGTKEGKVKLLFATEAYSMGTNAPDVRRIIHAGAPGKLETYVQEIGRAGRDGKSATANLFYNNSDLSSVAKGMTDTMRQFCRLTTCRRKFICQSFGEEFNCSSNITHDCCDNCEVLCQCLDCTNNCKPIIDNSCAQSKISIKSVHDKKKSTEMATCVEDALVQYFKAENESAGLPSNSVLTGLNRNLANKIASDYSNFENGNLLVIYPFLSSCVLENIALIINQCIEMF